MARYSDFCTCIWHIVGKDGFKWTKTDRDRQGQTRTREREREKLENIGSTWQRKNKKNLEFILRKVRIPAWEKVWTHLNFKKKI